MESLLALLSLSRDSSVSMKNSFDSENISALKHLINKNDKIVLTCHVRPDGDAMGSVLGLYHLLKAIGKKEVNVVIPDSAPHTLDFLPAMKDVAVNSKYDSYCARLVNEAGLIIMCDFNAYYRQDKLGCVTQAASCDKVLIDHHLGPDIDANVIFSDPSMSSTCELVFRIIASCGYFGLVNKEAATCLLTGIITDTQNFTVNCNNPEIYEILMRLIEKGADKNYIINEAVKSVSYNALRLRCFALANKLQIFERNRCALITLSQDELSQYNYQRGDTEGLVNEPLNIPGVVYSVFMREDPNCIKVSMRSKFDFPVNLICQDHFNGGGHLMASGGEFLGSLDECRNIMLECMKDYDRYIPSGLPRLVIKS